jgi:DNA-binding transcriptional LysR family regulator
MNLRRVSLFVQVVDHAGITAAARALGVPKSAVSQAVTALEHELGVRLLNRSSRSVSVTEAGAALHRRASPALEALDEARAEAVDTQGPLRGHVRLTAPVEVGTRLLEPVISRFLVSHPGVKLEVLLTTRVLDLAEEGIDLAVRGGPIDDESLIARRLGTQDAGLFAAPAYLRARGTPRRVTDLVNHDCIVVKPVNGRGTWSLMSARGAQPVEVAARLGVDHFAFAVRAATSGVGVALLPLFLCETEVTSGQLVRVLPGVGLRDTVLQLVYPSGRYLPRAVAALRDALLAELSGGARSAPSSRAAAPRRVR